MPIASASSGIVMPGFARTSSSACLERVPLPFGRPRRLVPVLVLVRRARVPARRRAGGEWPFAVTPSRACAAASSRVYSSTRGRSSFRRAWISRFLSSRKSAMVNALLAVNGSVNTVTGDPGRGRNFSLTARVTGAMRRLALISAVVALSAPSAAAQTWTVPENVSSPHTLIGPVELVQAPSGSLEAWWGFNQFTAGKYVPGHAHAKHPVTTAQFGAQRRAPAGLLDLQAFAGDRLLGLGQSYASGGRRTPTFRWLGHLGRRGNDLSGPDVVETAKTAYLPQLAVAPDGRALVSYIVRSGSRRIVRVATRGRSGRFGRPTTLFGTGRADVTEAAMGPRGDMLVVIARNGRLRARLRRSGHGWGAVQTLATASGPTQGQRQAAIDAQGRVEVVWRRHQFNRPGVPGRRSLEAAYVSAGGARFTGRQVVEHDGALEPHRIVSVQGGFAIAYAEGTPDVGTALPRVRFAKPRFGRAYDAAPAGGGLRDVRAAWDPAVGIIASWVQPTPTGDGAGIGRAALLAPGAVAFGPVEQVTPDENVSELAVDYDPRNHAPVAVWAARPDGTGPGIPIAQVRTVVRTAERLP